MMSFLILAHETMHAVGVVFFFFFFSVADGDKWLDVGTDEAQDTPQYGHNRAAMLPSPPLSICSVCLLLWINVCHGAEGRLHL